MKQQGGKTSQFVAHLATHFDGDNLDLPGFPEVLRRLEILLVDNNVDIQDVATLISSDPILTTKILQIANSATFNLSSAEIHNVDLAITRLGFELVRGITLAFAMRQALQQSWLVPIRSELEEIRRNSTDVASICGVIAKQVFKTRVDEAMLAGLVHQIGRLYIVVHTQKANAALEEEPDYQSTIDSWHPTFTRDILATWQFPEALCKAVEAQDMLLETSPEELELFPRLLCAAKLQNSLATGNSMKELCPEADEVLQSVQLDGNSFVDLVAAYQQDIHDLQATLI